MPEHADVVLGERPENTEYFFGNIRGAGSMSDGQIAVVDAWSDALMIFSKLGRLVAKAGRPGKGPGEFSDPNGLFILKGDTLAVWDFGTSRITLFDSHGRYSGTAHLRGRRRLLAGTLPGHRVVAYVDIGGLEPGPVEGDPFWVYVIAFDGTVQDSVGPFPGAKWFNVIRGNTHLGLEYVLAPRTHVAADGGFFVIGNSSTDSVTLFNPNAEVESVLRIPGSALPTTDADVAAYLERVAPESDNRMDKAWRDAHFEMLDRADVPRTVPRFADVRVDPAGRVWVERYPEPGQSRRSWFVFDSSGDMLGVVRGPEIRERVLHIGESRLLTRARGAMDIQLVKVYRIPRRYTLETDE